LQVSHQYILIDNDSLIRKSWQMQAKKVGVELHTFSSVAEFLMSAASFNKESLIYVDSDLDDGLLGEVEAKKIFDLGFFHIHLASGKLFNSDELPSYIQSAQSKRAPF